MVCGRYIKHPSTDAGGRFVRQIFSASEKHDALLKSSCTHACQSEIYSSFNCRQLEQKRERGSAINLFTFTVQYTSLCCITSLCSVWKMVCWHSFHLISSQQQHSVLEIPPLLRGGGLSPKMQREIAYFLASGKNYFYTISYLLMNQAHISKGVRVESFTDSL